MKRIPVASVQRELGRVLEQEGLAPVRAARCAKLFAENSRDGIYSHGIDRFPAFVDRIRAGGLDLDATPTRIHRFGALEQWDGGSGIGLLNAEIAMARATEIAAEHGLGCVGLRNTNHWMRAGAYALQAADSACIGICWTNTTYNMPPWGATTVHVGNNPIAIAIPRADGHVLLDMAMSQFSMGKLAMAAGGGTELPVPGGYDSAGRLTTDAQAVIESRRALPVGYWKGSALAFVLDLLASLIAGGDATFEIAARPVETNVCQVYIAISTGILGSVDIDNRADAIVADLLGSSGATKQGVRYPGAGMLRTRRDNLARGIPIDQAFWERLRAL